MPHANFHHMQTVEKFLLATLQTTRKHGFLGSTKDRGSIL
jgi:hypothetical protein